MGQVEHCWFTRRLVVALRALSVVGLVFGVFGQASASAQYRGLTDGVRVPASSLLLQDDAAATEINPAFLGGLSSYSLAYVHAEEDQRGVWSGRGDALHLGVPLWFDLAVGLSVQSVRPRPRSLQLNGDTANRSQAALSLAWQPSPGFSVGVTSRGISSQRSAIDGLAAIDLGLALRVSPTLGLSVVGRDLLLSRSGFGADGLEVATTLEAGVQLRPLGNQDVIVDVGLASAFEGQVGGRGGIGLRVPGVGRVSALAEVERLGSETAALSLLAELSVSYGRSTAALGGVFGDGYDSFEDGRVDWYGMLRVEGQARPGIPSKGYVLNLELSGLSPRKMLAISLLFERLRRDDRVAGVLLRPRGSAMGTAYAQELRQHIAAMRAAGKPVVCHLDNASGTEYYACAAADATLMDPTGSMRFMGGSVQVLLLGGTLEKLGIKAEFIRIGAYKSAPEQFTERRMTAPARAQLTELLDDVYGRVLHDVAADLGVQPADVEQLIDAGPQLAGQAQADGMVSGLVDEARLREVDLGPLGARPLVDTLPARHAGRFGVPARVGVVLIDGSIVDGESVDVPLLGTHMSGAKTLIRAIDGLAADPTVRAIVARVDSPGGAVLASDQVWRALYRAREKKPVIASMGAVAASGGYYVASAAHEIWATPSTLTGSIGIFYGKVDISPLARSLGVGIELLQRGKRAGGETLWRSFTADERAALSDRLRSYYRTFLARIEQGREMPVDRVDALGRGHVYSGETAKRHGLVDHLGGFAEALAAARREGGLPADAPVVVVPEPEVSLLGRLIGPVVEADTAPLSSLPQEVADLAEVLSVLRQLDGTRAMAHLPYVAKY